MAITERNKINGMCFNTFSLLKKVPLNTVFNDLTMPLFFFLGGGGGVTEAGFTSSITGSSVFISLNLFATFKFRLSYIFSATRNFALRDLLFFSISSLLGVIGFLVISSNGLAMLP